jgi:hypothetical protein
MQQTWFSDTLSAVPGYSSAVAPEISDTNMPGIGTRVNNLEEFQTNAHTIVTIGFY